MTKIEALNALEHIINEKWTDAKKAFERSKAGATSDQSKSEGKYDTRGLEESYLAHGLANAVQEYESALNDLNLCRHAPIKEHIAVGSLIHCKSKGTSVYFLLSQSGGGLEASVNNLDVTIITPESPLAKKLYGKEKGDRLETPPFQIIEVL